VVSGRQEAFTRDSKLLSVGAPTSISHIPSLGETMREEVLRAYLKEGPASGVPTQEKTAGAPVLVQAANTDAVPCIDNGHVNEVEPQPEDASGGAALIPGSPRRPNFWLPGGTASDGVTSVPGSFDIVDSGDGELGLSGYCREPPLPAS
jgi:hypothetical protein